MALIVAVGSRGRGFIARLLGSTSHALITPGECPVVVVRPHPTPDSTTPDTDPDQR